MSGSTPINLGSSGNPTVQTPPQNIPWWESLVLPWVDPSSDGVFTQLITPMTTSSSSLTPSATMTSLTPSASSVSTSLPPPGSASVQAMIQQAAKDTNLAPQLLEAVAMTESGMNPQAVSSAGAEGVMQLMPQTAQSLGVTDPFDAWQNIIGGAEYLKQMITQFHSVNLGLAAYNAGPGAVQQYGGIPPYAQTQQYVKTIEAEGNRLDQTM